MAVFDFNSNFNPQDLINFINPDMGASVTPSRSIPHEISHWTNPNEFEDNEFRPDKVLPPQPEIPIDFNKGKNQPPTGFPVGFWDDLKEQFGDIFGFFADPTGPIDDATRAPFKMPWDFFQGAKGSIVNIMSMLPMIMLMGGKMDMKKILLLVMMGGFGGALGGLFGGSSNPFGGAASGELTSSHTGADMSSMLPLMLMMGGSGGSSNKMLTTMMMAPMLGIDPMAAMMLGQFTNTSSGMRYRRRGFSAQSRRSYSAGIRAGETRGALLGRA